MDDRNREYTYLWIVCWDQGQKVNRHSRFNPFAPMKEKGRYSITTESVKWKVVPFNHYNSYLFIWRDVKS